MIASPNAAETMAEVTPNACRFCRLRCYPNATETMAERAWRYGDAGIPHERVALICFFADGSAMRQSGVETALSLRHRLDTVERATRKSVLR